MNPLSISTAPNARLPANIAPVPQTMNRADEGPHLGNLGAAGRSGPENCCYCLALTAFYGGMISAVSAGSYLLAWQPGVGSGLSVCAGGLLAFCWGHHYTTSVENNTP